MGRIDSDLDGVDDELELAIGSDPFDKDSDDDGVSDGAERLLGTHLTNPDTDGDGWYDGTELARRTDPHTPDPPHPLGLSDTIRVPTPEDPDADGLDSSQELALGTNPNDPDSDNDGLADGIEHERGTNPRRFTDAPDDPTTDVEDVAAELRFQRGGTAPGEILTGALGRAVFLDAARAQIGDPYRFGAETRLDDPDPTAFDSSELVEWAAAQAGIKLPDGSWRQYQYLHQNGNAVSVEDALRTPGALVFGFSSDPLASSQRPARSYVAISLGNGKVIDVSERAGEVRELDPGTYFTHGAVIPEIVGDLDSDGDGFTDELERAYDVDPFDPNENVESIIEPTPAPAPATTDSSNATSDEEPAASTDGTAVAVTTPDTTEALTTFAEPAAAEPVTYDELAYDESLADVDIAYEELTVHDEPTYEDVTYHEPSYDEPSYDEPIAFGGLADDTTSFTDVA